MSAHAANARGARLSFVLAWLSIWLAQVLPARVIADDALDPSWSQALGRFLAQGLKIGVDYVFTYGPLGYFSTNVDEPSLFWHKLLLWEIGWRLLASWFVARALWQAPGRGERAAAVLLLVFVPLLFDAWAFAVIAAVCSVLAAEERPRLALRALGLALLASLALVKFTFAAAAGVCVLALAFDSLRRAGARAALADLWLCVSSGLALWFAAGQGLSNLWPWLLNSLRIASAYNEGESKPSGALQNVLGLAALALCLFCLAHWALARPRRPARGVLALALAAAAFFAFKAGWVRGDDHTSYFLGFALCAGWLLPRAAQQGGVLRTSANALLAALALVGIALAPEQEGASPAALAQSFVGRLPLNARDVFLPLRTRALLDAARSERARRFDLPRIRQRVGRERIDVFDFHQGVALLNGLEYAPRPVFQSYVAFTPELQELDVRFYEGLAAPRFVLFKLETIDDRLPTMEHARLLETLLRLYRPVLAERRELLLERRAEALPPARRTRELERELRFGEELLLPATPAEARLLTLDVRTNTLGKLAQFLYRAPELHLELRDEFGNLRSLRVVPGMLRTGVLIDPLVPAGDAWAQFLVGGRLARLRSLRLVVPAGCEWMYEPGARLLLERAEGFAPPRDDALADELRPFVFRRMPDGMQLSKPTLRLDFLGRDCWFVFAPASMVWELPPGRHSLRALLGLAEAPRGAPCARRAVYRVGLVDGAQQKPLFERCIDLEKSEDRGALSLKLEFEAANTCRLVLSTALAEGTATQDAWCWWSEVEIDARK